MNGDVIQQTCLGKYNIRISESNRPNTKALSDLSRLFKGKTSHAYRVSSMEAPLGPRGEIQVSNEISRASKRGIKIPIRG